MKTRPENIPSLVQAAPRIHHPRQLFRRRLQQHFRQQWSAISSVVDKTVLLYLVLLGLPLGIGLYRDLWKVTLPPEVEQIPSLPAAIILLVLFSRGVLLFVDAADALFLRQQNRWMEVLRGRGLMYSVLAGNVLAGSITWLLLPLWYRVFHLEGWQLAGWAFLASGIGWNASLLTHTVKAKYAGLRKYTLAAGLRLSSLGIYIALLSLMGSHIPALFTAGAVFLGLSLWLMRTKARDPHTFTNDVKMDARSRVKLTDLLVTQALGRLPKVRSKTWLFRRSRRLYRSPAPDKRFASAGVKAFLRQQESLLLYLQMTSVGVPAVLVPPLLVKLIVYVLIMLIITYVLVLKWKGFSESSLAKVLPFTTQQEMQAGTLAVQTLLLLPCLLLSLVLGLSLAPGWLGLLIAATAGTAVTLLLPHFMMRPSLGRRG
ncbi:ABC transporter permease [Paenibacillus sp. JSM ZJ436]|uniref:ABC transporter permease n=1 Tax=Paenibacillus sp. JSM ZJ436 TaxID=3376190 RepID=UPI00379C44A3